MYTPWPGGLGPFISPLPELMMHLSDSWETINHRINNLQSKQRLYSAAFPLFFTKFHSFVVSSRKPFFGHINFIYARQCFLDKNCAANFRTYTKIKIIWYITFFHYENSDLSWNGIWQKRIAKRNLVWKIEGNVANIFMIAKAYRSRCFLFNVISAVGGFIHMRGGGGIQSRLDDIGMRGASLAFF